MGSGPLEMPLVNNLDKAVPRLRRELIFRAQSFGGKNCFVVEDPVNARFFRIGVTEYTFISLLDGRQTVGEVLRATRAAHPECEFSDADAVSICHWVVRTGLVQDHSIDAQTGPSVGRGVVVGGRRGGRLSPLSMQLPLFHPDRFFRRLVPWLGWCFSFPALLAWLGIMGWAVRDILVHGDRVQEASQGILAAGNWGWLALIWVLLKVVHECGHGIACKRLGGEVREAGIIFILLAPLAYVDVTSSWRLRCKWKRIQVAAAGMYVEMFLAAVATLIWTHMEPGLLSQVCFNVMTTASVMTILFNANPLMRFDGYYMFSDFLELPNLYAQGQRYVGRMALRLLFGWRSAPSSETGVTRGLVGLYGMASFVWRNMVFLGLVLTAATLLEGAGIVLSAIAVLLWSVAILRRWWRLVGRNAVTGAGWIRFALVGGGGLAALILVLSVAPWPGAVTAPAIVRYAPQTIVRTGSSGFVEAVHVQSGARVTAGQLLIVMANKPLEHELLELEVAIKKSQLTRRIYQRQGELAKAQAEAQELRTLETQLAEKRQEMAGLLVRAPCDGNVVGRRLDSLLGRYLERGSDLLALGDESAKEIRLSIAQRDIDTFRKHMNTSLCAHLFGSAILTAKLTKVEPQASDVPLDLSLCAPYGGWLTVRKLDRGAAAHQPKAMELLSPRFTGVLALDERQSRQVSAGQRARVALRPYQSVGGHLYEVFADWVGGKLGRHRSNPLYAGLYSRRRGE